jgi:gamma-glutamyl:cysteine ligase YbdK (ATP-grasp superfamily)
MLQHLASLLALSASSPFWRGEPTGPGVVAADGVRRVPALGPPPRFGLRRVREVVGQLEKTGCIADYTHIWWDIRPHPRSARSRSASATRSRGSRTRRDRRVRASRSSSCSRAPRGRREIPTYHRILTTENKWLAGRYGLEAPVMDLARGSATACRSRSCPADAEGDRAARARARRRARARGHPRHPRARQRLGPAAARLQREPRHRRGRERDRERHRDHAPVPA